MFLWDVLKYGLSQFLFLKWNYIVGTIPGLAWNRCVLHILVFSKELVVSFFIIYGFATLPMYFFLIHSCIFKPIFHVHWESHGLLSRKCQWHSRWEWKKPYFTSISHQEPNINFRMVVDDYNAQGLLHGCGNVVGLNKSMSPSLNGLPLNLWNAQIEFIASSLKSPFDFDHQNVLW